MHSRILNLDFIREGGHTRQRRLNSQISQLYSDTRASPGTRPLFLIRDKMSPRICVTVRPEHRPRLAQGAWRVRLIVVCEPDEAMQAVFAIP